MASNKAPAKTAAPPLWKTKKLYYQINKNNNKGGSGTKSKDRNHHLTVDKHIVDELLLVCGVIGSTVHVDEKDKDKANQTKTIVPVEDCLNWLQDLQRALRRDEDAYRPISLLLGQWKVVQQKLLPLVLACRYDTQLVLTIVKILVILTKPLSETAINAGRLIVDTKNRNIDDAVIEEQIKLRDNAIAQANLLNEYKQMFVHHPSHRQKRSSRSRHSKKDSAEDEEQPKGLLSIFVSLLAEPLSRTGMMRSHEDHLTVELILHLIRNLLSAGEPLFYKKDAQNRSGAVQSSIKLHEELIALFKRELVLDILLVIGQEMESRENVQYNLLVMEILHHLLKNQDPTLVARSVLNKSISEAKPQQNNAKRSSSSSHSNRFQGSRSQAPSSSGSLMNQLQKERQRLQAGNSSRHSNFGGTLVLQKSGGEQQYLTASTISTSTSKQFPHNRGRHSTMVHAKRKTKKHQHFIGSGRPLSAYYSRKGAVHSYSNSSTGPSSQCAQRVLHSFCSKFLAQCYGPVMKSLKEEFRRDSARLEEEDKLKFFRIVWFFCQWRRVYADESANEDGDKTKAKSKGTETESSNTQPDEGSNEADSLSSVGRLVFTMDVFTFNMVLTSTDYYMQHKKYKNLAQAVSLYTEMIRLLNFMYVSSDSMEKIMAMGLLDHLFYKQDPLDRLPKLLSGWMPGTFTVEYLCDLIELTHATLKILDANEKACLDLVVAKDKTRKRGSKKSIEEPQDRVTRMKERAAEFETTLYFSKKLVSNQVVFMFTRLLRQYSTNAPRINDYIVSFFVRLCKFVVASDDDYANLGIELETNNKQVTLEPMLFNIHLLSVLHDILEDSPLRKDKEFRSVISFASTLVRHFAGACEKNPMLYVETLFRHPIPHRFCERVSNNYVSEELIMIAEREILLEQSNIDSNNEIDEESSTGEELELETGSEVDRQSEKTNSSRVASNDIDDDEEKEMEFIDESDISKNKDSPNKEQGIFDEKSVSSSQDDNNDRWNDRRKFVPKRRLQVVDIGLGEESVKQSKEDIKPPSSTKKRIKRTVIEESSDEEEFGDMEVATLSQKAMNPNFSDSDKEE